MMYFIQAVAAGSSCRGRLYQAMSGSPCTRSSASSFYSDTLDQSARGSDENMTPHFTQTMLSHRPCMVGTITCFYDLTFLEFDSSGRVCDFLGWDRIQTFSLLDMLCTNPSFILKK